MRIERPKVAQRTVAAQQDASARRDLRAKAEIAPPSRRHGEQMRQPVMLKIGKPRDRRKPQTPTEKAGGLEHHVDARGAKRGGGRTIKPECDRACKRSTAAVECSRPHDL